MSVFRVHKNTNYTVVSNIHIFDKKLHNKAKGLLTTMLALPEDWNFNIKGLASISADGVDSVTSQLKELEQNGYVVRTKIRDEQGHFIDTDYDVYEVPNCKTADDFENIGDIRAIFEAAQKNENEEYVNEYIEAETLENTEVEPKRDFPVSGNPYPENPRQLNTNKSNTNSLINLSVQEEKEEDNETDGRELSITEQVKQEVDYDFLISSQPEDLELIDGIIEIIADVYKTHKEQLRIASENRSVQEVRCQFKKLKRRHIEYVLDSLKNSARTIHSPDAYLLTALYNAPNTIGVVELTKGHLERNRGEPERRKNRFNGFHQRDINVDELEEQLLTNHV